MYTPIAAQEAAGHNKPAPVASGSEPALTWHSQGQAGLHLAAMSERLAGSRHSALCASHQDAEKHKLAQSSG